MRDDTLGRTSHEQQHHHQQWGVVRAGALLENGDAMGSTLMQGGGGNGTESTVDTHSSHHHHSNQQRHDEPPQQSLLMREAENCVGRRRRAMVVALFRDGFVCRHFPDPSDSVEGFAQPYDSDASYVLGCIERGVVPDGLTDMITGASSDDGVVAEIWDYRESTAACPLSSVSLPQASPLATQNRGCKAWEVLLKPGESSHCRHAGEFAHFPELSPGELEILAGDAERQLLENGIPSSWGTPSSLGSQPDLSEFGFTSASEPGFGDFGLQDVWIDAELRTRISSGSLTGSCSARLNLVLDQDAFPGLGPSRHITSSVLLSPTEPKRQLISEAQRQQIARQKNNNKKAQTGAAGEESLASARDTASTSETVEKVAKSRKPCKKSTLSASCSVSESVGSRPHINDSCLSASSPSTRRKRANSSNSPVTTPKSSNSKATLGHHSKPVSSYASMPPLPATQHFLSKLKGKRQRQNSFEELQYGMPMRLTINHIDIFFHAAMRFERHHAFFLHTNVARLMNPEEPPQESAVSPVGSMDHLAEQLGGTKSPAEVARTVKTTSNVPLGRERDECEAWGTTAPTSKPSQLRILSPDVHGWGTQAYPIQLPALSVEDEGNLASLWNAWLALTDP